MAPSPMGHLSRMCEVGSSMRRGRTTTRASRTYYGEFRLPGVGELSPSLGCRGWIAFLPASHGLLLGLARTTCCFFRNDLRTANWGHGFLRMLRVVSLLIFLLGCAIVVGLRLFTAAPSGFYGDASMDPGVLEASKRGILAIGLSKIVSRESSTVNDHIDALSR